jgi:hypothetical protein
MVTKTLFLATSLSLLLATGAAQADDGKRIKYAVGGALLGIALAELAHDRQHSHVVRYYDDHGHGYHEHGRRQRHRAQRRDLYRYGHHRHGPRRYVVHYDHGRRGHH